MGFQIFCMVLSIIAIVFSIKYYPILKNILKGVETVLKIKSMGTLKFDDVYDEFKDFTMIVVIRSILERFMQSKEGVDGKALAMKEISDMTQDYFQGLVSLVQGNMGIDIIEKFYMFFKREDNNSTMILTISGLVESYSIQLIERMRLIEYEIEMRNRELLKTSNETIESIQYTYDRLVLSISEDLRKLETKK